MKQFIKFDDESALDAGLPQGVTHEVDGDALFSITEGEDLPEGARSAEPAEYEAAQSAADARMKAFQVSRAKKAGLEYEGVLIPFTSDAAMAFLQVEGAFAKMAAADGIPSAAIRTNMVFDETGSVLPVSLEGGAVDVSAEGDDAVMVDHHKFADVALWFTVKRNSFYQ